MRSVELGKFYRLFYPQVATVLTSRHEGEVGAMAAVSQTAISFDPPLVGVAVEPGGVTHRAVDESGGFALNWLDFTRRRQVGYTGKVSGAEAEDKLEEAGLDYHIGAKSGCPILDAAVAFLECSVRDSVDWGDHDFFVGEVLDALASDDYEEYWRFEGYSPLLYAGTKENGDDETRFRWYTLRRAQEETRG